jgi:hypothetical protein
VVRLRDETVWAGCRVRTVTVDGVGHCLTPAAAGLAVMFVVVVLVLPSLWVTGLTIRPSPGHDGQLAGPTMGSG